MEFLSVMFFGMAMQRIFAGLLRPAFESAGIFEIIGLILQDLFLPVALLLLDPLLAVMDFFSNLPEPVKEFVGVLILVIAAVAGIIMFVGIFMLAAAGIAPLLTMIGITGLVAFGWLIVIILAVAVLVYVLIKHWDKIVPFFKKIIDYIVKEWKLFIENIKHIMGMVVGIVTGNWDKVKEHFFGIIDNIKQKWKGLINVISMPLIGIGKGIGWLKEKLFGGFQFGGVVNRTGPYMLHKGETVTPSGGGGNISPTIIVNASVSSDYDVRRLAAELSKYWTTDYERMSKGRSIV